MNTFWRYTQLNDPKVLFLTIRFSTSNKVKWSQILLRITNNLIKYQSFVYTQLNDQSVLFQTSQFSIIRNKYSLNIILQK